MLTTISTINYNKEHYGHKNTIPEIKLCLEKTKNIRFREIISLPKENTVNKLPNTRTMIVDTNTKGKGLHKRTKIRTNAMIRSYWANLQWQQLTGVEVNQ